jgi:NTP pyrophosphatase (non-canonical NTP hydrolase)
MSEQLFQDLGQEIQDINENNGWDRITPEDWDDKYKVLAMLDMVHEEVSEATQAFRKRDKENFGEELADTVIRIMSLSNGLGVELFNEIKKKMAKNRERPYKHGNKIV